MPQIDKEESNMEVASKKKMWIIILGVLILIGICVSIFLGTANLRAYSKANAALGSRDYEEAISLFSALADYKDAATLIKEAMYGLASQKMDEEDYDTASSLLENLEDYEDSAQLLMKCQYQFAIEAHDSGDIDSAITMLSEIPDCDESEKLLRAYQYEKAKTLFDTENYVDAEAMFSALGDYEDAKSYAEQSAYLQTTDGQFLKALKEGLQERWKYLDGAENGTIDGNLADNERTQKAVDFEYDKISCFAEQQFQDKRLGEIATEYIACLNESFNALKYYVVDYPKYDNAWELARAQRTHLLAELSDDYGLSVDEQYADELKSLISDSEVYYEQERLKAEIHTMADNTVLSVEPYVDEYSGETLWYDVTATFTNTTEETLDYFYEDIQVLDADGKIIMMGNVAQISMLEPGQAATVDVYLDNSEWNPLDYTVKFIPHYSVGTLYE